jgi:L-lactate utilization protein LutC
MEREAFLEQIRRRLAGGPVSHESPPPPSVARAPLDDGARLGLFLERLGELDVTAVVVPSRVEAQAAVERLMAERGWASVACDANLGWPGAEARRTEDARAAPFGLSWAELAVAETGSVLVRHEGPQKRTYSLLPPATGFFLPQDRIVDTLGDALRWVGARGQNLPACLTFITGPSATADIAGVHVVGVHGPKELFVWVISRA